MSRKYFAHWFMALLAAAYLIGGCEKREINAQNVDLLMTQFQDGTLEFGSSITTSGNTIHYFQEYVRLANRHEWAKLSKLLIQSNSAQDISWFLLGLSAEGLGFKKAARQYFVNSINSRARYCLPGDFYQPSLCAGVRLPDDAIEHLHRLPRA